MCECNLTSVNIWIINIDLFVSLNSARFLLRVLSACLVCVYVCVCVFPSLLVSLSVLLVFHPPLLLSGSTPLQLSVFLPVSVCLTCYVSLPEDGLPFSFALSRHSRHLTVLHLNLLLKNKLKQATDVFTCCEL